MTEEQAFEKIKEEIQKVLKRYKGDHYELYDAIEAWCSEQQEQLDIDDDDTDGLDDDDDSELEDDDDE